MDSDDVKTPWFYPSAPKQQGYEVDCAKLNGAKKGEDSITIGVYSAPGFCRLEQGWHPDLILGEGSYSANSIHIWLNTAANRRRNSSRNHFTRAWRGGEQLTPSVYDWNGDGIPT